MKLSLSLLAGAIALSLSNTAHAQVVSLESFASPGGVSQLIYAPAANELVIRNSGSAIKVLSLDTHAVVSTQMANSLFTDMDATASGRYVYAADYGYENIGYGTPASQSYVHRLDLQTGTWAVQTTDRIAGRIEAVDDHRFALQSLDQWVSMSVNAWGNGTAVDPIGNQLAWSVYSGNIAYDATHGRLLHGSSGISSPELHAFKLTGNTLTAQDSSGIYGAANVPGAGSGALLASDDSAVYYGRLQFDPLDMNFLQRTFAETIIGANGAYAFGSNNYYDAHTGALVGSLGGTFTTFAFSTQSSDFWGFNSTTNSLVHFAPVPEPATCLLLAVGIGALGLLRRRTLAA